MRESHRRSIVKALSWRVVALLITASVAWIITGSLGFGAIIGGIDTVIKLSPITFTNDYGTAFLLVASGNRSIRFSFQGPVSDFTFVTNCLTSRSSEPAAASRSARSR